MSEVEARTREALHHVVDDLDVTDGDIARLEAELMGALAAPRLRGGPPVVPPARRRWGLAAAAVVVAAAIAGGLALSADDSQTPSPAGAPTSDQPLIPADIVGTWQNVPESPWVWVFTADGRVGTYSTAGGYLAGELPIHVVSRSGDLYTVREEGCDRPLHLRTVSPGVVLATFPKNSCTGEDEPDQLSLERISPAPYLDGELSPRALSEVGPGSRSPFLHGVWLHVETHTLLVVGDPWRSGLLRYVLDDDGDGLTDPDQRGRVTLREDGSPVFLPDSGVQPSCPLILSSVTITGGQMRTTSPSDGCLPGPRTWVRIT
ncbi:hypothetical protein LL946_18430 [Knoellia locipacati]|uniref:hypothetical protein n=1 Tax=Knoellia locipacati TaxID=882824 RepID=UPI00384EE412